MKQLQQLKEKIILALHPECKSYEEAIEKEEMLDITYFCPHCSKELKKYESDYNHCDKCLKSFSYKEKEKLVIKIYTNLPITLGRLLQAFKRHISNSEFWNQEGENYHILNIIECWKITECNGFTEATLDDQSEETINKLLELFNN